MTTLTEQINAFREKFNANVSPNKKSIIESGIRGQEFNRGLAGLPKVGDVVTDFSFTDQHGTRTTLSELVTRGPIVLTFYRGGWCPYCNLELNAYQRHLDEIHALGAEVLALSPETPDRAATTAEKNQLQFQVATDEGLRVAKSLGLVFALSEDLKVLYEKFNHALSATNTEGLWELPVPATIVIGQDRRIIFAYVNLDYRERLEPSEVIKFLETL